MSEPSIVSPWGVVAVIAVASAAWWFLVAHPVDAEPPRAKKERKMSDEELRKRLTPIQYQVTQEDRTERPFSNEFWDNHEAWIYVDVVSGEPLFSSKDKGVFVFESDDRTSTLTLRDGQILSNGVGLALPGRVDPRAVNLHRVAFEDNAIDLRRGTP